MKRFISRLSAVVLLVMLATAGWAQKNVLAEDFSAGKLPANWTAGTYWTFQNGAARFLTTEQNVTDRLIAPVVDVTSLTISPRVALRYKQPAYRTIVDTLVVEYRTQATDPWTELARLAAPQEDWTDLYIELPAAAKVATLQLGLLAKTASAYGIYIDYIAVENKALCDVTPTMLPLDGLSSSGATIQWNMTADMSDASLVKGYNIKLSTAKLDNPQTATTGLLLNVTGWEDDFYELENLQPNTTYYAYVQYDCGDADLSNWAEQSFLTPCVPVAAPIAENFENETNTCARIVLDPNAKSGDKIEVSSDYVKEGSYALKAVSTAGRTNHFYLPELSGNLSDWQISFYAGTNNTSVNTTRKMSVGLASTYDPSSITVLRSFTLPKANSWDKIILQFPAGVKGQYVVLSFGDNEKANTIFVDDIRIEQKEACPEPFFIKVSNVAATTARLSWFDVKEGAEYNLVVSPAPVTDFTKVDAKYIHTVSGGVYSITGLEPLTTYYVYMQMACASAGTWTSEIAFKTLRPVTFPYTERFDRFASDFYTNTYEAVPDGWITGGRKVADDSEASPYVGITSSNAYAYVSTEKDAGGSPYVAASLHLKGISTVGAYAILPAMPETAPAVNECMLTFEVTSSAKDGKIVVGVCDEQSYDIPTGMMFLPGEDANFTPVDTISLTDDAVSGWQYCTALLTAYKGTGKYVALRALPVTSTFAPYIDNVQLMPAPACFNISALKAEATGVDGIRFSWDEIGKATAWKVKVASAEMTDMNATADIYDKTVSSTEVSLNGLTANTTYYIYVRSDCDQSEWQTVTVQTLYALTVPYFNDFDLSQSVKATTGATGASGSGSYPQYWLVGNLGATPTATYIPYTYNTAWTAATGEKIPADVVRPSLYIYASAAIAKGNTEFTTTTDHSRPYAIMPPLQNAAVKDVTISFNGWANSSNSSGNNIYGHGISIGVLDDPTDLSTLVHVADVDCETYRHNDFFIVPMSAYTGTGKYIVFYIALDPSVADASTAAKSFSTIFCIDNLSITLSSMPQQVTKVTASEITAAGAKIAWTENGQATSWNIKVYDDPDAKADDPDFTPVISTTVNSTPEYTLSGLKPGKRYYVYVQAVQGANTGAWGSTDFWAGCGVVSLPWFENFNASGGVYSTADKLLLPCISYGNTLKAPTMPTASGSSLGSTVCPDHVMGQDPTVAAAKYVSGTDPNHYVVQMYATSSASSKIVQIDLPEMPGKLNELQMTFYLAPYSTNHCAMRVGIQTDTEFIPVQDFLGAAKAWTECITNFSSLADDVTGHIAIRADYDFFKNSPGYGFSTSYTGGFVDDILIEKIPLCAKVTKLSVSAVASDSAVLAWEQAMGETQWNVKVASEVIDPATDKADILETSATAMSIPVKGLAPSTTYYAYVQAIRPDKDCTGDWSNYISFRTLPGVEALPFFEDFENEPEGSITNTDGAVIYLPRKFAAAGEESAKMWMYMQNGGNTLCPPMDTYGMHLNSSNGKHNFFILPPFSETDTRKLQLEFYAGMSTTTTGVLEVGTLVDPSDISTYEKAAEITLNPTYGNLSYTRSWQHIVITFDSLKGGDLGVIGRYIVLKPVRNSTSSSASMFVDNITVKMREPIAAPGALWPSNRKRNGETDELTLGWVSTEKNATFRARFYEGLNPDTEKAADKEFTAADANELTATGLKPNTVYTVVVRAERGGNVSAWSKPIVFRTTVANLPAVSLPYAEDFENPYMGGTTSHTAATGCGWTIVKTTGALSNTAANQRGGQISLTVATNAQLMTPALNVADWKNVTISFDAYNTGASASYDGKKIKIFLAETNNAAGVTGAEPVAEVALPMKQWQKVIVSLQDLTSVRPFNYIYLTAEYGTAVDNFMVTEGKPAFVVTNMQVLDVADTAVVYSFEEFTEGVTSWVAEYGPAGFTLGTGMQKQLSAKQDTLIGLTPNTAYQLYVKAAGTDTWSSPIAFTTVGKAVPVPYVTGFEDADDNAQWTFVNKKNLVNDAAYPSRFIIGDAAQVEGTGSKALFVTTDGTTWGYTKVDATGSGSNNYIWAARTIRFDEPGDYTISFRLRNEGIISTNPDQADFDYVAAFIVPSSTTWYNDIMNNLAGTAISRKASSPETGNHVIIPIETFYGKKEWTNVEERISIYKPGTYELLIHWKNYQQAAAGKPVAVDSIAIEKYNCSVAQSVKLTAVDGESASFSWYGGSLTNFEVAVSEYKKLSRPFEIEEADYVLHTTISNGPAITINNLKPSTSYAFYVRSICPDGPTEEFVEYDFQTVCDAYPVPFEVNTNEKLACWVYSTGVAPASHKMQNDAMKAEGIEYTYNYLSIPTNGYVILPLLDAPIDSLDIQVQVWNTQSIESHTLYVGVVSNPFIADDFEALYTYRFKNTHNTTGTYLRIKPEEFEFYTNRYKGDKKFIMIQGASDAAIALLSVKITRLPECVNPYQVEITDITTTSAKVNWITGDEKAWNIYLTDEDAKQETVIPVTEQPYTLTGLKDGNAYTVAVQAICSDDKKSDKSVAASFSTDCGLYSMPMSEDFSKLPYATKAKLRCWTNINTSAAIEEVLASGFSPMAFDNSDEISVSSYESFMWSDGNSRYAALGDPAQLVSWDYTGSYSKTYYKWMISPVYQITAGAVLSFDLAYRMYKSSEVIAPATPGRGRFFVAVSADGGNTYDKADATEIQLFKYGVEYKSVVFDLSAYAGKNITVAFYHEGASYSGNQPYVFIDNMRINCATEYTYEDNACEGAEYTGYGFNIAADAHLYGRTDTIRRVTYNEQGCDSLIVVKLTTQRGDTVMTSASICDGDVYEENGFEVSKAGWHLIRSVNEYGCDRLIYLNLSIKPGSGEHESLFATITTDDLPYKTADGLVEVPADFGTGVFTKNVLVDESICKWNDYTITVNPGEPTALDTDDKNLVLYPNPVERGQKVTVTYPFTAEQLDGMTVQVFDFTGALVANIRPQTASFQIEDFTTTGLYTLRIIAGTGEQLTSKFIVK